jgi:hypothetical protein
LTEMVMDDRCSVQYSTALGYEWFSFSNKETWLRKSETPDTLDVASSTLMMMLSDGVVFPVCTLICFLPPCVSRLIVASRFTWCSFAVHKRKKRVKDSWKLPQS